MRRNPGSGVEVEADRLIRKWGWREALHIAHAIYYQKGGGHKGHWRAVMETIQRRAPTGVVTRQNPRRASSRSKAGEMLAFTVTRGGHAVGTVVTRTAVAAAREAKAAGLKLGREVKSEFCKNPPRGATLSRRAEALTYQHAADGEWYRHKWAPGVVVRVSQDRKRVTLFRPDGKPVAGEFDVP